MSESTARADRFGAPASSSPAYLWEVANKPVSVRLNLEMVERLERDVVESFRSLSSRGSEIGGLLLGSVQSGTPARVWVESYELVACDYARGPLYQLSEADVERFKQAAAQRNAGNLRVVGFFRSHTRKGLGLDADDTSFLAGHFRDPQQIALLIRPYASKPSTAGIFMWENGAIHSEASYQEFPFRRSELERVVQAESRTSAPKPAASPDPVSAATETSQAKPATRAQIVPIASRREITMPPPPPERPVARTEYTPEPAPPRPPMERPAPAAPPPAPREPEVPAFARSAESRPANPPAYEEPSAGSSMELSDLVLPPLERPRRGKMVWITAGCAAGLLVVSGALIYPGFGHKGKAAATAALPALSLHVERQANELLLKWDPNSDLIKSAEHAVLAISDGDQHENVNLDLNQLRAGSVEYLPSGSDVSFQLSVVGQNSKETHSESVRVLKTHAATPEDIPAPQQAKATPPPQQQAKSTPEPSRPAPAASAPATPAPAPQQPVQVADNRPKPQSAAVREFHPESLADRLRPVRSADLPEAPGITAAAPVAVNLPGLNTTAPLVAPPLPSRPAAPAATPGAALKTGGRVQQAQIISSPAPDYPLVAKQNHVSGTVVVSAMIGVDGRVKSATAISGPALLQRAAVDAVRHWIYRPTTLDGAPTESETRVEVKFSNGR